MPGRQNQRRVLDWEGQENRPRKELTRIGEQDKRRSGPERRTSLGEEQAREENSAGRQNQRWESNVERQNQRRVLGWEGWENRPREKRIQGEEQIGEESSARERKQTETEKRANRKKVGKREEQCLV